MASPARRQSSTLPLILALLLLLGLLLLILPSLNLGVKTTTQTDSEGQCQFASRSFYTRQEAFTLAQAAELYRGSHPFGGNYSLGSYTICYTNNTQQRFPSPPAQGYDNVTDTTRPLNATHGEQAIYKWLQNQLAQLSLDQIMVLGIYVVIFSQVTVCLPCRNDMIPWQRDLRQRAGTSKLLLSIWDLNPGFNPAKDPAGPGKPVAFSDLERVPLVFAP